MESQNKTEKKTKKVLIGKGWGAGIFVYEVYDGILDSKDEYNRLAVDFLFLVVLLQM